MHINLVGILGDILVAEPDLHSMNLNSLIICTDGALKNGQDAFGGYIQLKKTIMSWAGWVGPTMHPAVAEAHAIF